MVPSAVDSDLDATGMPEADALEPRRTHGAVEQIRLLFANAWGAMGAAWGVQPSVARVHGYLLAHGGTLTEREVRQALDLSHRAASLALAETEEWGLVERVSDPRRVGRRGPSATAYAVVGDRWVWFQRIAEQRKLREADPLLPRIETCLAYAEDAVRASPDDPEVLRLRNWLQELLGFMQLFDRAVGAVARADKAVIASGFAVLARLSDESLDRLVRLFGALPEDELASTLDAISRVSPAVARRVLGAAGRMARIAR